MAKFVFKRVDEVNVGEAFSGDSFKTGVNFEAGGRKCVVWAIRIVKHGTDRVGKSIGSEANEDEANAGDFFEIAVCCLVLAWEVVVYVE